jgi:hypothetical protein
MISTLLAFKKIGPFLQSTCYWMSCSTFLRGGARLLTTQTLAARGLEELFFQLCCCVSFWFWWEIGFCFTYLCT